MSEDPPRVVEVFDLASGSAAAAQSTTVRTDQIEQGRHRPPNVIMDRWPWWRRNDPLTRGLTLVGVVGLVIALVAGYDAIRAHPGTQYFINEKLAAVPAVTVDVLGCPRGVGCAQVAVPSAVRVLVLHVVPSARIRYAGQTVDAQVGRVYRREIDLTLPPTSTPPTTMRFVAQCVPGSGPVPAQPLMVTAVTIVNGGIPAPNQAVRVSRRLTEVIPGARGCSLLAEADTTLSFDEHDGHVMGELLTLVAKQPSMMVAP